MSYNHCNYTRQNVISDRVKFMEQVPPTQAAELAPCSGELTLSLTQPLQLICITLHTWRELRLDMHEPPFVVRGKSFRYNMSTASLLHAICHDTLHNVTSPAQTLRLCTVHGPRIGPLLTLQKPRILDEWRQPSRRRSAIVIDILMLIVSRM